MKQDVDDIGGSINLQFNISFTQRTALMTTPVDLGESQMSSLASRYNRMFPKVVPF